MGMACFFRGLAHLRPAAVRPGGGGLRRRRPSTATTPRTPTCIAPAPCAAPATLSEAKKILSGLAEAQRVVRRVPLPARLLAWPRGELVEAATEFEKALALDKDHNGASSSWPTSTISTATTTWPWSITAGAPTASPVPLAAWINLGILYEDEMRFRDAEHCYRQVLAHDPNHPRARLFFKDCQASKGMYYDEEAERGYTVLKQLHEIPVTDFELSVRSRNCLRKMNIRTLGDLTRTTEAALLSSKNFGETSLAEIKEMMQAKGLRLGMSLEGNERSPPRSSHRAAPGGPPRAAGDLEQADRRPEPFGPSPKVHEQAQHPDGRRSAQAHRRRAAGMQELRRHLAQRGPGEADGAEPEAEERLTSRRQDHRLAANGIIAEERCRDCGNPQGLRPVSRRGGADSARRCASRRWHTTRLAARARHARDAPRDQSKRPPSCPSAPRLRSRD